MIQRGFFFRMSAFADATSRPASSRSALSTEKNTGLNGELRFRSSSVLLPSASSDSDGCAGTGNGSSTRRGASGTVVTAGGAVIDGGGWVGGATGGWGLARGVSARGAVRGFTEE